MKNLGSQTVKFAEISFQIIISDESAGAHEFEALQFSFQRIKMNLQQLHATTQVQLRNIQDSIHEESLRNRPENTTKTYNQYQREFIRWCRDHPLFRHQPIPELVSADVLLLYLNAQDGRLSRRAGESEREVGIRTYSGIVSAIIDLWKQQVIFFLISLFEWF